MAYSQRISAAVFSALFGWLLLGTANSVRAEWLTANGGGGALWPMRVSVTVTNSADKTLETFVPIAVESLSIAGQKVDSLRLFGPSGNELLFELTDADAVPVHRGIVPEQGRLLIPVTVEAKSESVYTLYYGNEKSFPIADWLTIRTEILNGSFESVRADNPAGWRFDLADEQHKIALDENAHSGRYSVKTTVADDASASWIAARQQGLTVTPGERWRLTGFVKGENINGFAGWYVHIGNKENAMVQHIMPATDEKDFDWTAISEEITIADGCDQLEFGTVLRGTGTAWFDDVKLERLDNPKQPLYTTAVSEPESMPYAIAAPDGFDPANPENFDVSRFGFKKGSRYAVLRILNEGEPLSSMMAIDVEQLRHRIGYDSAGSFRILSPEGKTVDSETWNKLLFLPAEIPAQTAAYYLAVEDADASPAASEPASELKKENKADTRTAFPGTMEQTAAETSDSAAAAETRYPAFFYEQNLVQNGTFADGGDVPDNWNINAPDGFTCKRWTEGDMSGIELSANNEAGRYWPGLRQSVPVQGGASYLIAFKIKTLDGGAYRLNYHQRKADGSFSTGGMNGLRTAPAEEGWNIVCQEIRTSDDTEELEIHLTLGAAGTYRFADMIFIPQTHSADLVTLGGGKSGVFQIPPVVKVFPETAFSLNRPCVNAENPAVLAAARNEAEVLQLAFRPEESGIWRVAAESPVSESDRTLPAPKAGAVGYVPVNYPTNYYHLPFKTSYDRQIPTTGQSCDGWAGWWPDPVIPIALDGADDISVFDPAKIYDNDSARLAAAGKAGFLELSAGINRSLWLTFSIPSDAEPGLYTGNVVLKSLDGSRTQTFPYTIRVFSAVLPDLPANGAIYDLRATSDFIREGESYQEANKRLVEFMAERKLSPDSLPFTPVIEYDAATGKASCDWTEFDEMAHWYFDKLHVRWSYTPNSLFYMFGWGLPPKDIAGFKPYEGNYPYEGADRGVLNADYKKAYQARLAYFWNHLKEKGWQDRFVLYISDEPFYSHPEIIDQMKALCAMIHEVDPEIPIYSSTWRHIPEWDGSLDVWGIGHYGIVPPEQLQKSKARGDSFWWTTDGQMCLDTPYSAIERMLPWWCWRWGADSYEFWGATWYTYNPFDFGWHRYIFQSDTPTNKYFVRYPNGDGYIFYPGSLIGLDEIITSVRCEAARDGQEDALLLAALNEAIERGKNSGEKAEALEQAKALRDEAVSLVPIPTPGGLASTAFLPNPEILDSLREQIGAVLEELQ